MSLTRTIALTQVHEEFAALCRATHLHVVGLH
jgi:hypothetical protein